MPRRIPKNLPKKKSEGGEGGRSINELGGCVHCPKVVKDGTATTQAPRTGYYCRACTGFPVVQSRPETRTIVWVCPRCTSFHHSFDKGTNLRVVRKDPTWDPASSSDDDDTDSEATTD